MSLASLDALLNEGAGQGEDLFANRREWKLVVEAGAAEAIRGAVATRLPLETHVAGRDRARVLTVYFDGPAFALYQRAITPELPSVKFRLRLYEPPADRPDGARYFECKMALPENTSKRKHKLRFRLNAERTAALLGASTLLAEDLFRGGKRKFWTIAAAFVAANGLTPRLTVSYDREAYVSPDGRVRVTFDYGLTASRIAPDLASPLGEGWRLGEAVVLEVKHLDAFPDWLADELAALGLPLAGQSFSKFKTSVAALYPEVAHDPV